MEILAHRGLWIEREERNTSAALWAAFDAGYGVETDIRDLDGELVISHDMPSGKPLRLDALLRYYREKNCTSTLALNIKSDGLQKKLRQELAAYEIECYFVFDMSVPDTLGYLREGFCTFIRRSELEDHAELTGRADGVWVDELTTPWITSSALLEEAAKTPRLCIVSAELHGRDHSSQWETIATALSSGLSFSSLLLCTDHPREAQTFFKAPLL